MSPEAKLAQYAERIHLQDEDVDYLLSVVQEARGLGSLAGSAAEREACARIAEDYASPAPLSGLVIPRRCGCNQDIAAAIRRRGDS